MNELETAAAPAAPPTAEASTDLAARFRAVRETTSWLAAPLSPEDCTVQSMPDASPTKWHLAHTTWFFETFVLVPGLPGYREFHPDFRVLFNSYYNAVGAQHARFERGLLTRPSLAEVRAYRAHVDAAVLRLLERRRAAGGDRRLRRARPAPRAAAPGADPHRHQARSSGATRCGRSTARALPAPQGDTPALGWRFFEPGLREIGHAGPGFAFDNEGPRHRAFLAAFELAARPVTYGEYLEFIADGGYSRPELWLSDGWGTAQAAGWRAPLYWREQDGGWHQHDARRLAAGRPGRAGLPRQLLRGRRLRALGRSAPADRGRVGGRGASEGSTASRAGEGNFLEDGRFHPAPARPLGRPLPALRRRLGVDAEPLRRPTRAITRRPGALGEYNGKFMCNQLVLRGGSCATPRTHIRATYRNFFPPDARWQFTGLRLARDAR